MSCVIEIDDIDPYEFSNQCDTYSIDKINFSQTKYNIFFKKYMMRNVPCVIKNISDRWNSTKYWVDNNFINYQYLCEKYGDVVAPVTNCGETISHCKRDMHIKDYIEYLLSTKKDDLLYLKDLHLRRLKPNDNFYEVPFIFGSDWLNEFALDHNDDDFMFVYIGPTNSWTPLHADVYNSFSWSVNVVGCKKWILLPPGEEDKIKDKLGNLPLQFDPKIFTNIKYFEIIQEKGDAIFVPSGWYHQVINLVDTVSINHNWINACNIEFTWNAIQECLRSVENEIKEFRNTPDYTAECQIILKSLFGMNYKSFIQLLCYISNKRVKQIEDRNYAAFYNFILGIKHITFDLSKIYNIMSTINKHHLFFEKYLLSDIEPDFLKSYNSIAKILNKNM